jgi:uncharacterized protein YbbC (DUF1343 family)
VSLGLYNAAVPVTSGSAGLAPRLTGRRVGLVANPASIDARFVHVGDLIASLPGVTLAALFGPQHGFRSDVQDNMVETDHASHPTLGVPIYSLYGDSREPDAAMLAGLDLLVIDLPDVGTRVYTYIHTMTNCLRACARHGVPVLVCDRPNPVGGHAVEGGMLEPGFESFVGLFPIPLRHGLTIGEMARFCNESFDLGASLDVLPVTGWHRGMYHDDTGLPWVMPSPNLPTLDSAIVYPGQVLLEGTNLSEGRGTTRPFELTGAPWLDAHAVAAAMNDHRLPGVHARPAEFQPTFQKHAGTPCGGCQLHVTDRNLFQPVLTTVALLQTCRRLGPDQFRWREPPYEYETVKPPIDILSGSDRLRRQLDDDIPFAVIAESWESGIDAFRSRREGFLLY